MKRSLWLLCRKLTLEGRTEAMGPLIDAQASKERGCAEDDGDGNRDVEKLSGVGCISMEELTEFGDIQDGRNKVNRSQRSASFEV